MRSISRYEGKSNYSCSNMSSFILPVSHHPLVSSAPVLAAQVLSAGQDIHCRTSQASSYHIKSPCHGSLLFPQQRIVELHSHQAVDHIFDSVLTDHNSHFLHLSTHNQLL